MRVIADLVVNHTSDQHPWFQSARSSTDSPYRDWYVWRDDPPPDSPDEVVFPDQETSIWNYDEQAGAVLPAPLLHAPARPQHRQPAGARRDRQGHRLLAASWACPASGSTPCRSCSRPTGVDGPSGGSSRTRTSTSRDLRAFLGRRSGDASCSARSTCRTSSSWRSSAASDGDELHDACSTSSACRHVPGAGPRTTPARWSRRCSSRPETAAGRQWATLRPQPRRAHAGQAERRRAPGGVRRLRARRRTCRSTAGAAPPAAADARRGPAPDPDGLQPAVLAARHPGAVLRRGDRHGREPRRRGPAGRAHADAVDAGRERRVLHRRPARLPGRLVAGRLRPEHVNVADQRRDPDSLLNFIAAARSAATASAPSSAGATSRCSTSRPGGAGPPLHLGRRVDRGSAQLRRRTR